VADIAGSVPFIGFPVRWLLAILSLPRLRNELEEVAAVDKAQLAELDDRWERVTDLLGKTLNDVSARMAKSQDENIATMLGIQSRSKVESEVRFDSLDKTVQEVAGRTAALAEATEKRFAAMEEERAKELSDLESSFWGDLEREIETLWKALAEANADNASSLASIEQKRAKDLAVFESTIARDMQREAEMLREVILRSRNETESKLAETKQELAAKISAQAAVIEKTTQEVNGGIEALAARTEKKLASLEKRAAKGLADVESSLSERLGRETAERAMKMNELASKSESALELALAPFRASAHAVRLEPRLYFSLQEAFRGSREEVKDKLRIYLDPLTSVGAGSSEKPVLDIGCGRGEWLELLKENGFQARGVDESHDALASCVEAGLDVVQNDALEFLRTEPAGRYGAVSLIHVAEHLPIGHLVDLLQEVRRVLAPGGMLIAETPNPENLLVGTWTFYLDPTHQHPLPARLMSFLAEQVGFTDVRTLMLHPFEEEMRVGSDESELAKRVNEAFYGPRDYAILATKGAENG
jgi:O-antigen chain-terminating methyltransferase